LATLAHKLDRRTRAGELYELKGFGTVRCIACALRCVIRPGRRGVCRVRHNDGGTLMVPWSQCDPTEKKPLFHVFPGSDAVTFGMLGCDLHCDYCQNWLASQALRDEAAGVGPRDISADAIVELAERRQARLVVSSYNEPLITAEWAAEVFRLAKQAGLHTACVSNGNATPEALDYLRPWTDAYKIDLKTMSDRGYRKLGCTLEHVLDTLRHAYEKGFWLEIVTLVVPGFNDSEDELRDAEDGCCRNIPQTAHAGSRDRARGRARFRVRRQSSRHSRGLGEHLLPGLQAATGRTGRLPRYEGRTEPEQR
jgi:pyruvate formate lyase activating enzyme